MREWWSWRERLAVDGSGVMAHIGRFRTSACVHCRCLALFFGRVRGCPHYFLEQIPENNTIHGGW